MSLLSMFGCGHKDPAHGPGEGPGMDRTVHLGSIYFSATHGYHAYSNIGYRAERLPEGGTRVTVEVGDDRDRVFFTEGALMDTLETLVRKYRMHRYKGHYDPPFEVMDGDSWTMEISFTDGTSSSCGGYMAYPPGKGAEAIGTVEGILSRWLYVEPAEEVALLSFSYRFHDEEGDGEYSMQMKDSICSISSRPAGAAAAASSDEADPYLAKRLAGMIRWNHLGSYTGEKLSEEDSSRPRWVLKAVYADGTVIEAMDYLDRDTGDSWRHGVPSISEQALRYEIGHLFSEELQRIEDRKK